MTGKKQGGVVEAAAGPPAQAHRLRNCLVVEDHKLIGQLLATVLRGLPGIGGVTLAMTAADGIAAAAKRDCDLLILDLMLPDGDGLDVLRGVAALYPAVDCIILSSKAEECICPAEYAANIQALLDKTAAFDSLRCEIEVIVRRRLIGLPATMRAEPAHVLRPREFQVFQRIGEGMTTREIAQTLGITMHTVNSHRKAIVAKLGVVGAELVRLAALHNQILTLPGGSPADGR